MQRHYTNTITPQLEPTTLQAQLQLQNTTVYRAVAGEATTATILASTTPTP